MSLSLKPRHLKRYKDIALLFLKHGRADMVDQFEARAALSDDEVKAASGASPDDLAKDLESMGPTFVKLGQLLSSRADLLPEPYLRALARLQDNVAPFPFEQVQEIVTQELGVRISKAFQEFDPEPTAAASLGQVHKAVLRNGRRVVVKIQRPDIRKVIAEDLEAIEEIIEFFDRHTETARRYQFRKIFEEFQKTLIQELDYQREAANLDALRKNLEEFEHIVIPAPVHDYSTRAVLTMDFVLGKKVTSVEALERMDLNGGMLADELFKAYLKQVLVDGLFHADPHPGNIFLTDDKKIGLIDLGMVGRTSPDMQDHLIKLLIAISDGKGADAVATVVKISQTTTEFASTDFQQRITSLISEQRESSLNKIDVGRILLEVGKAAGQCGLFVPVELTMLGKTLLQLDQVGRHLDENFNPNAAIQKHVSDILRQRLSKDATPGRLYTSLLDMKDFVGGLPSRVNRVLDAVGNSELQVKVKSTDAPQLLEGFQKIANRITTGLILAALIIGAALLMQIQTTFTLFGYPGLAILCFLAAAGGGFWLVISIMMNDHKTRKKQQSAEQGG